MKATELIVKCLENEGVDYIFGVPGEEDMDLPALRTALSSNKLTIIDCPVDASENLRLTQTPSTLAVETGFHP